MVVTEQVHRYPRRLTALIEVLSALAVAIALLNFSHDLLLYLWSRFGLDTTFIGRAPLLREVVVFLRNSAANSPVTSLAQLLPSLGWLLLTLLLALLARNSLPTIRSSARGLLVEFAGDWLPVPWESVRAIKVTEDLDAQRFVLLAETERHLLTGWHRCYSFLYRLRPNRGFLITSSIGDFDGLVKTVLEESDRVAKVLDKGHAATLDEHATSPLFRFLLNPGGFFSQKTRNEVPIEPGVQPAAGTPVSGAYPGRITGLFGWTAVVIGVIALIRYVIYWLQFLALTFPNLLNLPVFNRLTVTQAQLAAPWWLLIAAHLMLLIALFVIFALRNLLPAIETRREGLAVRYGRGWSLVPWSRIDTIKETELSETNRIVLIQAKGGLPFWSRAASLLYDGSFKPGILVTSALSHYDTIMERLVVDATRYQAETRRADEQPIVQGDAPSPLLLMTLRAGVTLDQLVDIVREDNNTLNATARQMFRAAWPMAALALPAALLPLFDRTINQGILPDARLPIGMLAMFVLSFLEWPLMALGAMTLDEVAGRGEENYRPFYLYPLAQLPRILPLVGAVVMVVLGVPVLPVIFWLGAIFWSFLLAAGLWESLYGWSGSQLLVGGLVPVVYQLLVLLAYMLLF